MNDANRTKETSFRVEFVGVGRNEMSWSESTKQQPTESVLVRMVRKKKALMSSDIWCEFDEDLEHGTVYAGMRAVGAFRVTEMQR